MTSRAERGRDLVQATFGGALYQQGRGFYSALELFAILRGEVLLERFEEDVGPSEERVLPTHGRATYLRPSHDHARRLLVADDAVVEGVFARPETRAAVSDLLRGIEAPVPGRRQVPDKWWLRHFYPYPAAAIHYDAVERRGRVSVERYQFRGAGGLAHKILRTDPDPARLAATRSAFQDLLADGESAVGLLLKALSDHDEVRPAKEAEAAESKDALMRLAFEDDVEDRSLRNIHEDVGGQPTRWMHLLREGVHRMLRRSELSDFDRTDGLMHWVPFCIAMHQLAMARRTLGTDENAPNVFDAGHTKSSVRSLARRHLGDATSAIKASLYEAAIASGSPELTRGSTAWWKGPRTFFTTTMFAVGALNANVGQRHFELRPQLLQTIVHALVDEPMSIDHFCSEILGEQLCIVCDRHSATRFGPVGLDGRHLQRNGEFLAERLDEVGLLRSFSDFTLMVGIQE